MRFAQPQMLWLAAVLLPALAVFLVMAWRKKQKLISQFVQSRLLANLTVGVSQGRQKLRLYLLFFATAFALLALARPQWGFEWEEATSQGLDVLVAIDTSKSMLAEDVSPNRLARAKLAAFDLLRMAKSDRFGLIAFAGTAFLQCPLTLDEEAFRQSVEVLNAGIIPQGGSAVAEAIDTALSAFEKSGDNHKILVIFTDGEDHDSGAIAAAEKAAKEKMKVFTIGVGTPEGELLRVRDEDGNLRFLKDDQGNAVKSRLNETLLRELATKADGFYLPLVGANPMETLYSRGLAPLPKSDATTKLVKNHRDQYKWPLGLAILILISEIFLPQRKTVRRTEAMTAAGNANLKKAVAVSLLLLSPVMLFASPSRALRHYEAGNYAESFAEYQKQLDKKTNDFRLHYNAGDAAYKAKQYDIAKKRFDSALNSPDLDLQQRAHYNLGNTLYQIGEAEEDPSSKHEPWEQAVKNYESALKLNPQDADAKNNLSFLKYKIEELKKQQQQQKQQNKDDQNKDKKEGDEKNQENQQDEQNKQDSAENKENEQKQDQKQDSAQQDQKDQQQQQAQKEQEEKQKQQQQQQQQQEQAKKEQEEKQKSQQAQQKDEEGKEKEQAQATQAVAGQMTQQQAMQFLEAQKQQDRTLIFVPQEPQKQKNPNIPLKDW